MKKCLLVFLTILFSFLFRVDSIYADQASDCALTGGQWFPLYDAGKPGYCHCPGDQPGDISKDLCPYNGRLGEGGRICRESGGLPFSVADDFYCQCSDGVWSHDVCPPSNIQKCQNAGGQWTPLYHNGAPGFCTCSNGTRINEATETCPAASNQNSNANSNNNNNSNGNINSNINYNANVNLNSNTNTNINSNTNAGLPSQTITGEVSSSTVMNGGNGSLCTEFTVSNPKGDVQSGTQYGGLIEQGRRGRTLTTKDISLGDFSELATCGQVAQNLQASIVNSSFTSVALTEDIRESYSTMSPQNHYFSYSKVGHNGTYSNFYFNDSNGRNYYDYIPDNNFAVRPYGGKSYAGNSFCRIHIDPNTHDLLAFEVRYKPSGTASFNDNQTIRRCVNGDLVSVCEHRNVYNYNFFYQVFQNNSWTSLSNTTAHKCENVRLQFTPSAEWFATLKNGISIIIPLFDDLVSPPTSFVNCNDNATCLSNAPEYQLTPEVWGRGVQKTPVNFIDSTQNSINGGSDSDITCSNAQCSSSTGGNHVLYSTVPASSYLGQCRGFNQTVNVPEVSIPQVTSSATISFVNRPPTVSLAFAKDPIGANEEVTATCDIIDPDDCTDKISKIKWTCFNYQGQTVNCMLNNNGTWTEGTITQEIAQAQQTNPYHATIQFKSPVEGGYALTCEAWDSDTKTPASSIGIAGISVGGGVIAAQSNFCAVISEDEGSAQTACGQSGTTKYKAYSFNIDAQTYKWKCSSNSSVEDSTDPTKECTYNAEGSYIPSLSIVDKSGKTIQCSSTANFEVRNDPVCYVEVRKSGSNNEFSSSIRISKGDSVEARIRKECLDSNQISWETPNGTNVFKQDTGLILTYPNATQTKINASISQSGQDITCSPADIRVNESLRQGGN